MMRRGYHRSSTWSEWVVTWLFLLVGVPLGLAISGFCMKLVWNCFMLGWELL